MRVLIIWLMLSSCCYADYKAEVAARKERAKELAMERGLARHKRVLAKKNSQYNYQYFYVRPERRYY